MNLISVAKLGRHFKFYNLFGQKIISPIKHKLQIISKIHTRNIFKYFSCVSCYKSGIYPNKTEIVMLSNC